MNGNGQKINQLIRTQEDSNIIIAANIAEKVLGWSFNRTLYAIIENTNVQQFIEKQDALKAKMVIIYHGPSFGNIGKVKISKQVGKFGEHEQPIQKRTLSRTAFQVQIETKRNKVFPNWERNKN